MAITALETFQKFSPSNQREYIDWVKDAKTEETRARRLDSNSLDG
ncbi:MAG TPA: YdeI/OmpD-associated family protein [Bacteroidales bacterium]|nr:YdeI/OmpD-associated family protein [Bacteroidales bacterium]